MRSFYHILAVGGALQLLLPNANAAVNVIPEPGDYKVRGLEKYGNSDDIYSGFMPLNLEDNSEGSYFFALVKRRPKDGINFDAKKDKLVVWLNGGPGCSSMVGMMWENGPFTIQEGTDRKYDLKRSEYAWNEVAHMLFVEQPVRTGFSTAAKKRHRIRDENEVASDFYRFLVSFMRVFPELERLPFFISGESYAGTYIPWMAEHILREQARKDRPRDAVVVNLQGVAIGNGQIDFVTHEASYAEYGYFHGLIPLSARQHFEKIYALCIQGVETAPYVTREVFNKCSMMSGVLEAAGRPNEYNTNTFKQYDGVSKPEQVFHRFFNDPEVQEMLHVRGYNLPGVNFSPSLHNNGQFWTNGTTNSTWFEPDTWVVCNNDINDDMVADRPTSAVPALQSIARDNIRVLLYSGEFDMNVNFIGTQHVLEKNLWLGRDWASAERSLYRFKDNVAGEYSNIDGFAFLIVRNAGHLLPMDLPATALDMLNRFLNDRSFKDVSLPTDASYVGLPIILPESDDDEAEKTITAHIKHKAASKGSDPGPGGDDSEDVVVPPKAKLSSLTMLSIFILVMALSICFFRAAFHNASGGDNALKPANGFGATYQSSDGELNSKGTWALWDRSSTQEKVAIKTQKDSV